MTQLDRLEALAEKWKEPGKRWYGIATVNEALPDLIRVARAAKNLRVDRFGAQVLVIGGDELQEALGPLFAEVES